MMHMCDIIVKINGNGGISMLKKRKSKLLLMCLVAASLFLCACGGGTVP